VNYKNVKLIKWKKDFQGKEYYHKWSLFILDEVLTIGTTRDLKEIYESVKRKYPSICVDDVKYWGRPKWMHMVRSVLDGLMKKGFVQSVDKKGKWKRLK